MRPSRLRISHIEKAVKLPTSKWHGKCTLISNAVIQCGLVIGSPIYGHYLGPVDPAGFWGDKSGGGFVQHGWVLLRDGRVLDPTRFSFENIDPYIHIGPAEPDYDEGGNAWRMSMRVPCPGPGSGKPANLKTEHRFIEKLFERFTNTPFKEMTWHQANWVANLTHEELGLGLTSIYETLANNNAKGFIPHDNWTRAVREERVSA